MDDTEMYLNGKRQLRFEAIQRCLVPRSRQFTDKQRQESLLMVNDFLTTKGPSVRSQFFTFLVFIDAISILSGLHCFRNLKESKQNKVMKWFFNCPISLFRKGFWGLNTLAKMGVYSQEDFYDEIGYKLRETPHV